MADQNTAPESVANIKHFHLSQLVISRSVARHTLRSASLWAVVFGIYVASKSVGYATAYPTAAARAKIAVSLQNNIGLNAIMGVPHHINTVLGGTAWNTLSVMSLIGAIWASLLATRTFRGEEDAGRWELFLSGQTTARRAAIGALAGLGTCLALFYVIIAAAFIVVGRVKTVGFGTEAALFFALAAVSSAAVFMAVGALASQLMPTRSRATSLTIGVFGIAFLVRAMADTTTYHWLLDVSPLGWIERLHPLYDSRPLWLVPICLTALALSALTVLLAGRRDMGAAIFADRESVKSHTKLLNQPFGAAIRLTRSASLSWLTAVGAMAIFFSLLTKSAAQAFNDSSSIDRVFSRLEQHTPLAGVTIFLGFCFLVIMIMLMAYAASAISAIREDEATGYLDNILVRPVGRLQWLWGRVALIGVVVILIGLVGGGCAWLGLLSQHLGVTFHTLLLASLNAMAPALLVLGIGVGCFGLLPRQTSVVAYGVIAWSFLIQVVSSGTNINHWLLDTSLLHDIALAPTTSPNWTVVTVFVSLGVITALVGALAFRRRDLQTE